MSQDPQDGGGFTLDQLMELAGLAVAQAVAIHYPPHTHHNLLILCGPGNNGGDGLVAARHLCHFGYQRVALCSPKVPGPDHLHSRLTSLAAALGAQVLSWDDACTRLDVDKEVDLVVDALFGFSFDPSGGIRAPYDAVLSRLTREPCPPIAAVDVPSGWPVDGTTTPSTGEGETAIPRITPSMLISLTAPKQGCAHYVGPHYLGGRFISPALRDRFQLQLPAYPGTDQIVRLDASRKPGTDLALADMRITYDKAVLVEEECDDDPLRLFTSWLAEAKANPDIVEANAMTVASVDPQGQPSARVVLLNNCDERGFVFYTNYDSRKGRELDTSGKAALVFFWEPLQRSVRVEGRVARVGPDESDAYFASRPRGSRLGAWVSPQSQILPRGRAELDERQVATEHRFAGDDETGTPIPRPPHWGGYLVRPTSIEFWQGRPSRLHDRIQFVREDDDTWVRQRLAP